MAKKKKKKELSGTERKRLRTQQIIFIGFGIIIILSMLISMVGNI
jgi:predicted nucleic acid-binding Zn ribbon protein